MSLDSDQALFLAGPTAVGKSAIALALAQRIPAEIVSVDSMQVYRGLDIGTDKPDLATRRTVAHHLIDVVSLTESFQVARFVDLAGQAVGSILNRHRIPLLCGGTGLYFKALLDGVGHGPAPNPALRRELEATPLPDLLRELGERDPQAWGAIDRQNPRRVRRAIEILRITGRPLAAARSLWPAPGVGPTPVVFGLARDSEDLRRRIHARVDRMFAAGLVAETGRLLELGLAHNPTASQALGYRQVIQHLRGQGSLPDTVAFVKNRTWQYARRQMTWFRRQLPTQWLHLEPDTPPEQVAADILARWHPG